MDRKFAIVTASGMFLSKQKTAIAYSGCAFWCANRSDAARAARKANLEEGWWIWEVPADPILALTTEAPIYRTK